MVLLILGKTVPAVYPLVHILSIFTTGLAGIIFSLAVYLKSKRKLRRDFSSGQGLFTGINFILCQCIFTLEEEINKEVSKAFHLPLQGFIFVQGQENKTKQNKKIFYMKQQKQLIFNLMERKNQQMEKHCVCNKQPSWDCSTIWCFCCWVWYSPTHSLFPLHVFSRVLGLGSHQIWKDLPCSPASSFISRREIITLPAGPICVLHLCVINYFIVIAQNISELTSRDVGNFI